MFIKKRKGEREEMVIVVTVGGGGRCLKDIIIGYSLHRPKVWGNDGIK
jgi:hypothetical protein